MQLALSRCGHSTTRSLRFMTRHLAMQTSGITSNVSSSRPFLYLQPTSTTFSSFDRPRLLSVKPPNDIRPTRAWTEKAEEHQNGAINEDPGTIVLPEQNTATLPFQTRRGMTFPRTRTHKTYFGMTAGWLLRHTAKGLGYEVTPDGFVRVSDVVSPSFCSTIFSSAHELTLA